MIYVDSLPYYIAKILANEYPAEFLSVTMNNPGFIDSSPIYRTYITGRLNYLYEPDVAAHKNDTDNIWAQLRSTGIKINAAAPYYPITGMSKPDTTWTNVYDSENGISLLSPKYQVSDIRDARGFTNNSDFDILSETRENVTLSTEALMNKWIDAEKIDTGDLKIELDYR